IGRKVKGGKSKTTEPGICAPFIVSWPDHVESNKVSDALIDFSDIFSTCLDIAGIEPMTEWTTDNNSYIIDGKSFKDVLLKNKNASERDWILGIGGGNNARLTKNGVENQYNFRDRVLRNRQYKLYINSSLQPEKFYDLLNDPGERINLIDSLVTPQLKNNYSQLADVIKSFPLKDNDPKYKANPSQSWDVAISAQSQIWKK
ncbi:MAG: N-acetylgalactosamine 6-sulfate sulfatase, partial [Cyclobacteriaceae bacterium]|nr:N-acetylgalactosamine 6-sulfate sulfatase [Cyclobacteriaceae bacterium]